MVAVFGLDRTRRCCTVVIDGFNTYIHRYTISFPNQPNQTTLRFPFSPLLAFSQSGPKPPLSSHRPVASACNRLGNRLEIKSSARGIRRTIGTHLAPSRPLPHTNATRMDLLCLVLPRQPWLGWAGLGEVFERGEARRRIRGLRLRLRLRLRVSREDYVSRRSVLARERERERGGRGGLGVGMRVHGFVSSIDDERVCGRTRSCSILEIQRLGLSDLRILFHLIASHCIS